MVIKSQKMKLLEWLKMAWGLRFYSFQNCLDPFKVLKMALLSVEDHKCLGRSGTVRTCLGLFSKPRILS